MSADRPDGRATPLLLLPIVRPNQCGDLQLVGDGGIATATVGWVADVTGGAWPHDLRRATGKACMIPIILGRLDSSYRDGERDNSRRRGRTKMPLWCNTHTHSCQSLVGTRPSQPRQRPPESERCNVFVTTQRATEWKRRLMAVSSVEHELEVDDAPETRAMKDVSTHIPIIEKSARRKCLSGSLPCVFCASKRLSVLLIIRRQAFCGLFYEIQIRKFTTCTERSSGHCTYIGAYTVSQKTRH